MTHEEFNAHYEIARVFRQKLEREHRLARIKDMVGLRGTEQLEETLDKLELKLKEQA